MNTLAVAIAGLLSVGPLCASPRVTFERTIPPPQKLGTASDVAVVYAIGDNDRISTFLDSFIDQANKSGTLRLYDATTAAHFFSGEKMNAKDAARVRRQYPADLYVRITAFTCRTGDYAGEGGAYDQDNRRVRRRQAWVDAFCEAKLEIVNAETLARVTSFKSSATGTSPRVTTITPDIAAIAIDQAARYTGVVAAEQITPRRVRETIALEDSPRLDEAVAMIEASKLNEARRILEAEAKKEPDSAPLRFNLAAVSEAAGDIPAAKKHYDVLRKLAPSDRHYRAEFEMFRRRNALK